MKAFYESDIEKMLMKFHHQKIVNLQRNSYYNTLSVHCFANIRLVCIDVKLKANKENPNSTEKNTFEYEKDLDKTE